MYSEKNVTILHVLFYKLFLFIKQTEKQAFRLYFYTNWLGKKQSTQCKCWDLGEKFCRIGCVIYNKTQVMMSISVGYLLKIFEINLSYDQFVAG